ncbi:hypothetical protein Kpol_2000p57 [Vanderwaltozyma polyspora DSM 70294]|uniref:SEC14 homolog 3 n=1 Tax=Vanderwaltozyma polyspora (strain ATCC 22028 / DSM 70294 / BCRC 21397 / CBS 2163 / NBRC 10782 / NRRL Y-8283 / UCD 57-17) TaxID=436907 RepID=A7TF65_VANPO|nr:uncharacterized protein Kpol_2000p57 [Vanderwaltozyma polyspora DSM 70294]EDO19090.1 hypothetical protein Kpol_2000p57 [Vanderwaltozyma polyspora DSM 70294]
MGLFSRKQRDQSPVSASSKADLIPIDQVIVEPPEQYGKASPIGNISEAQYGVYRKVLEHFQDDEFELPLSTKDKVNRRCLSSWEKFWLTRECILRFLRAAKWDRENTIKNLEETMSWRREVGITYENDEDPLTGAKVAIENETGKEVLLGFDRNRRPIFYMKNGRQNTEPSFRQVQQLIYMMEAAVTLTPQGVEKLTVLIDLKGYKEPGIISDKSPPLSITKLCLKVMQDYFPERLGKCLLTNIPWYAWAFLKMVYPFLDPNTREKTIFDEPFDKHIEPSQLEALYNGRLDFKYNHKVYWPDLVEKVESIRQRQYDRFVKFGGNIGLSEYDLKGSHDELIYEVDYVNIE